jgi:WD40 repeat protein
MRKFCLLLCLLFSLTAPSFAQGENQIVSIELSHSTKLVALSLFNGDIQIRDTENDDLLLVLKGHRQLALGLAWNADDSQLLSGSFDRSLRTWDVFTGQNLLTISSYNDSVYAVEWSPDGSQIIGASTSETPELRIWDALTGNPVQELALAATIDMSWNPSRTQLALASSSTVYVLNWDTLTLLPNEAVSNCGYFYGLAWHPNEHYLAAGTSNGCIVIWDTETQQLLNTLNANQTEIPPNAQIRAISFDSTGSSLYSFSAEGIAKLQNWQTGQLFFERSVLGPIYGAAWMLTGELFYAMENADLQRITPQSIN